MGKVSIEPFRPIYPSPAALITSMSADGKVNIITLGEVYNLSVSKPVIGGV
jgi:flavin reductase (DIM6/NTAB) family NADH-FMN oxidoreductase RutF